MGGHGQPPEASEAETPRPPTHLPQSPGPGLQQAGPSDPPSTASLAEATASRAAKVTSPAWCGWARRSSRAWWLPSAVTVQSASSGCTEAPFMYQVASPTGTVSLRVQLKLACPPARTVTSWGASKTSRRQPVGRCKVAA